MGWVQPSHYRLLCWANCAPGLSLLRSHLGSSLDGGRAGGLGQGREGGGW